MSEAVHSAVCDWTDAVVDAGWLPAGLRSEVLAKPESMRRQSCAARLTARGLLSHLEAADQVGAEMAISLSHCGEVSAVAIAPPRVSVGVDVERCDPRNVVLLPRLLSAKERTRHPLGGLPRYATLLFSLKEAAFKASGQRYCRFPRFQTYLDPVVRGVATITCLDDNGCDETRFSARYWFDGDLVIAVVCSSGAPTTPVRLAPEVCGKANSGAASALRAVEE
jgi:4'-phosphopantetheinyl transferase EntD